MRSLFRTGFAAALAGLAIGCSDAELTAMTPGGNVATGQLECWLTMEFKNRPDGDARDIRVHFSSEALREDAEFGWDYIAAKDVIKGEKFGEGNRKNDATTPETAPPLGQPVKVKFPLAAKPRLEDAGNRIWLVADLYWGGEKQDSVKRNIRHVYASETSGL